MDAEWTYSSDPNPNLNPKTSPMVNVIMGPEYFTIWSLIEYPNETLLEEYEYNRNEKLKKVAILLPHIKFLAGRTSLDIPRIQKLYKNVGVMLQIRRYDKRMSEFIFT